MHTPTRQQVIEEIAENCASLWEHLRKGRDLTPPDGMIPPDFDAYELRFAEITALLLKDTDADVLRAIDLHEGLVLDLNVTYAALRAEAEAAVVLLMDFFQSRIDEKKFELSSEARNELEDLMQPYHDGIREQMLSVQPIAKRRELEEAQRKLTE